VWYELVGENRQLSLRWGWEEALLREREKLDGKYVLVSDIEDKTWNYFVCTRNSIW